MVVLLININRQGRTQYVAIYYLMFFLHQLPAGKKSWKQKKLHNTSRIFIAYFFSLLPQFVIDFRTS